MRVFAWEIDDEGARRRAVPPSKEDGVEVDRLPQSPSAIEEILGAMVRSLADPDEPSALYVGLGETPSPQVGVHRDDLVEICRTCRDGRIHVTYAKARWQQVHFIGRMPTLDVAKGVRARLIALGRTLVGEHPCEIGAAGHDEVCDGEVTLFALVGTGPLFNGSLGR